MRRIYKGSEGYAKYEKSKRQLKLKVDGEDSTGLKSAGSRGGRKKEEQLNRGGEGLYHTRHLSFKNPKGRRERRRDGGILSQEFHLVQLQGGGLLKRKWETIDECENQRKISKILKDGKTILQKPLKCPRKAQIKKQKRR